jgi:hypothetical protein
MRLHTLDRLLEISAACPAGDSTALDGWRKNTAPVFG